MRDTFYLELPLTIKFRKIWQMPRGLKSIEQLIKPFFANRMNEITVMREIAPVLHKDLKYIYFNDNYSCSFSIG